MIQTVGVELLSIVGKLSSLISLQNEDIKGLLKKGYAQLTIPNKLKKYFKINNTLTETLKVYNKHTEETIN